MGVPDYGLLIGTVVDGRYFSGNHYQIRVKAGEREYRIAVNIQSGDGSEVMTLICSRFSHEFLDRVASAKLDNGFLQIGGYKGVNGWGMDFLRRQMLDFNHMTPMPLREAGPDNDLLEKVGFEVKRAQHNGAKLYAWGSRWEDPGKDKYFTDMPDRGIHDIHMNQGNPKGKHYGDNGTWQDGALAIHYDKEDYWVVVFLAFQSQFNTISPNIVHTDDRTGHPIQRPILTTGDYALPVFGTASLSNHEDQIAIIATALYPTYKVMLLNKGVTPVTLENWKLVQKDHKEYTIPTCTIPRYSMLEIPLEKGFSLDRSGDIIVLLDNQGIKVHGVSYTKRHVRPDGQLITF